MEKTNWSPFKVILYKINAFTIFVLLITIFAYVSFVLSVKIPINESYIISMNESYIISMNESDIISILALAISLLTFVFSFVIPLFSIPILCTEIEDKPVFSRSLDENPSSWFHRLLIYNNGLKPANNCVGKLIEIRDDKGQRISKFDPLPLFWTHQNSNADFKPISIFGRGDYAILDILQEKEIVYPDEIRSYNLSTDDAGQIPCAFHEPLINNAKDKLPLLRVHLTDPEKFPYNRINSSSPGSNPILCEGVYYLHIGVYSVNGASNPEWYRLDIKLSSRQEIDKNNPESKVKLIKVKENKVPYSSLNSPSISPPAAS